MFHTRMSAQVSARYVPPYLLTIPCNPRLVAGVPQCSFELELHAAFHLAHKYQCHDVEARVLFVLKKYYTSDFTKHDSYATSKYTLLRSPPQTAVAAVNIARPADAPSMLPFAPYIACTLKDRVLDGYERRDGSVEHPSTEDLKLCMNARGPLGRELAAVVNNMFAATDYQHECEQPDSCRAAEKVISAEVEAEVLGECDVLESRRGSLDGSWVDYLDVCKLCKRKLLEWEKKEHRRVWMQLPEIFRLTVQTRGFTNGGEWSDLWQPTFSMLCGVASSYVNDNITP